MKLKALQPVKDGTKTISIKIPQELYEKISHLKTTAKSAGFKMNVDEAATLGILKMVSIAEKELKEISKPQIVGPKTSSHAEEKSPAAGN
jgi:hypothetical protein